VTVSVSHSLVILAGSPAPTAVRISLNKGATPTHVAEQWLEIGGLMGYRNLEVFEIKFDAFRMLRIDFDKSEAYVVEDGESFKLDVKKTARLVIPAQIEGVDSDHLMQHLPNEQEEDHSSHTLESTRLHLSSFEKEPESEWNGISHKRISFDVIVKGDTTEGWILTSVADVDPIHIGQYLLRNLSGKHRKERVRLGNYLIVVHLADKVFSVRDLISECDSWVYTGNGDRYSASEKPCIYHQDGSRMALLDMYLTCRNPSSGLRVSEDGRVFLCNSYNYLHITYDRGTIRLTPVEDVFLKHWPSVDFAELSTIMLREKCDRFVCNSL
jgi:hypothetical protein